MPNIRVDGNAAPFAVGKMLVSDSDIKKSGMKGKGMHVLHVYRDALWAYGGRKVPNEGFQVDQARPVSHTSVLRTTLKSGHELASRRMPRVGGRC